MNRLLVIDANWYLHRIFNTVQTNRDLNEVLPYNFLSIICKDALAVRATHLEVAFDGDSIFRYDIYPEYKENRKKAKEKKDKTKKGRKYKSEIKNPIYEYLPAVFKLLESLGIKYVQPKKHEADDVLRTRGWQSRKRKDTKVILATQDKDNFQSLTDQVVMYDSSAKDKLGNSKPRYIKVADAEKSKGCAVARMVDYQTLIGDATDNIPKLLPPAKALAFLNTYGSLKEAMSNAEGNDRKWLKVNMSALRRNRDLVKLIKDCVDDEPIEAFKVPKVKKENLPKSWYKYQDFLYPKTQGLFG